MTLEFEIKEINKTGSLIIYEITRKGLKAGLIALNEPYNNDHRKRTKITIK